MQKVSANQVLKELSCTLWDGKRAAQFRMSTAQQLQAAGMSNSFYGN
jgi:hypothetical protein